MSTPEESHRSAVETAATWSIFEDRAAKLEAEYIARAAALKKAAENETEIKMAAAKASSAWREAAKAAATWITTLTEFKILDEVLNRSSGEDDNAPVIAARHAIDSARWAYQEALEEAEKVEKAVQDAVQRRN
jgi:hypothetical protein